MCIMSPKSLLLTNEWSCFQLLQDYNISSFTQVNGKRCGVAPSQDSDTLFVGNISKTWTKEAVCIFQTHLDFIC